MSKKFVYAGIVLAGFFVFCLLIIEAGFAQVSPGGGTFGPGGRLSEKDRKKIEKIKKTMRERAEEAVLKALKDGKSEQEARAAAQKAIDKILQYSSKILQKCSKYEKRNLERTADRTAKDVARKTIGKFQLKDWREISPVSEIAGKGEEEDIAKKIADTTLFEDFKDIKKLELKAPVIIFFYTKDKSTKEGKEQLAKCNQMRAYVLIDPDFEFDTINYLRLKIDVSKLNKPLKNKYGVESVPKISIFDCAGGELYSFTDPKTKAKKLSKKLNSFIKQSHKAAEKAWREKKKKEIEKKGKK